MIISNREIQDECDHDADQAIAEYSAEVARTFVRITCPRCEGSGSLLYKEPDYEGYDPGYEICCTFCNGHKTVLMPPHTIR